MTYNEREYAICVASGMGLTGTKAITWIKDTFDIKMGESTYWRDYANLQATPFKELERISVNKIILHLQRISYFYHLRTKINKSIDELDDKPEAQTRAIIRAAELEKYIAQLESMSRTYFDKATKEGIIKQQELALIAV